jgi:hypothetical protein
MPDNIIINFKKNGGAFNLNKNQSNITFKESFFQNNAADFVIIWKNFPTSHMYSQDFKC